MIFGSMRSKKLTVLGAALALGASMLLAGCGGGSGTTSSDGGAKKEKALTIGLNNAPAEFNPLATPDNAGHFTSRLMYDTLLGQPEPYKFTPHLAVSFETKDKQTYTVKLNPKAVWSDGKPITADDVIFTINLAAKPGVQTSFGRYIKFIEGLNNNGKLTSGDKIPSLKKIDDHTFEFKTKKPSDPNIIKSTIGFQVAIVPKHVFEKLEPKNIPTAPEVTSPKVFSGPYKFVKYVTNDHLELEANDKYVLGAPKIKKVFLTISKDINIVVNLKAGKITMNGSSGIGKIPVREVEGLKKDSKLDVKFNPATGSQVIIANNQKFDEHFRRGMAMAIDREKIKDQLLMGHAELTPTIYTKGNAAYDPNVKNLPFDLAKAKEELAKSANFDPNKELILSVPLGNSIREQSSEIIAQNLQAAGMKIKISKMDFPTLIAKARKGEFDLVLIGPAQSAEPDYGMYFTPGSMSNWCQTDDPELVQMFVEGTEKTDFADRKKIYSKVQQYLTDKQYMTMLYNEENIVAQDKSLVGGLKPYWEGSLDDIYKWEFK